MFYIGRGGGGEIQDFSEKNLQSEIQKSRVWVVIFVALEFRNA